MSLLTLRGALSLLALPLFISGSGGARLGWPAQSQHLESPEFQITGVVLDADAKTGIASAVVTIASSSLGFARPGFPRELQVRTDANGSFSFQHLPSGSFTLIAKAAGYVA